MGTVTNVKIEPCVATFGQDVSQIETIVCAADVSKSLQNKAFVFWLGAVGHYCYFNVNSEGSDPAYAGLTGHAVAIATNADANTVAAALEAVLEAITGISSTVSTNTVTWTHETAGYSQPAYDVNTGFTFAVTTEGDSAADVGYVQGDIEVTQNVNEVAITAHETGSNELSSIITGKTVEVGLTLEETTVAQLRKMLTKHGAAFTPTGAAATEVFGLGTSKDFTQTLAVCKKLVLHPKVLGSSDKSRDMTFWLAFPKVPKMTFSGENILSLPVTFKIFPDMTKQERIRYYAYGDGSQTLT